jgi:hypothetical protein
MKQSAIQREFSALPPELQRQVLDYIAFLKTRYVSTRKKTARRIPLEKEPAIGMWADRKDMEDSTTWVRSLRRSEEEQLRARYNRS